MSIDKKYKKGVDYILEKKTRSNGSKYSIIHPLSDRYKKYLKEIQKEIQKALKKLK